MGENLSLSTLNRYRSPIMRALSQAQKARWIDHVPYVPRNAEPEVRVKWITQTQVLNLINALELEWMKDVCTFALATSARMTKILSLTRNKIDLSGDIAKSGLARSLLLGKDALTVIEKGQAQKLSRYVFHRGRNKQIKEISYPDFNQALEKM